ncbi:hypothetical protein GCM10026983_37550 [Gracilibacillus alcaliphilus]
MTDHIKRDLADRKKEKDILQSMRKDLVDRSWGKSILQSIRMEYLGKPANH